MKRKKEEPKIEKWSIEITKDQLNLISRALEFTSRFACGQIGHSYLPYEVQELFYVKDKNNNLDWTEINKRRDMFDALGNIMKTTIHPNLSIDRGHSYGINKVDFADNLYDIYKMINHKIHLDDNINVSPDDVSYNVNSYYNKFGNLPDIKVTKLDE
jgi:hypothetical protein